MGKQIRKKQIEVRAKDSVWNATLKETKLTKQEKRKSKTKDTTSLLLPYCYKRFNPIRDIKDFHLHSFNVERRSVEALKFLFCKYSVPKWLPTFVFNVSQSITNRFVPNFNLQYSLELLSKMGKGESVREFTKHWLSKKEYATFIKQKKIHTHFLESFFIYCKSVSRNISHQNSLALAKKCDRILEDQLKIHLAQNDQFTSYQLKMISDFIEFIGKFNLDKLAIEDIFDFLFINYRYRGFSFKGRTSASVLNLVNTWHEEMNKTLAAKEKASLDTCYPIHPKGDWELILKDGSVVKCEQIKTYKALQNEGRKMHNCVACYHARCSNGSCAIYSLSVNNDKLATLEVIRNDVVQARGPCNKQLSNEARTYYKKWLAAKHLRSVCNA